MNTYHAEWTFHHEEMFQVVERDYQNGLTGRQFSQREGISLIKLDCWIVCTTSITFGKMQPKGSRHRCPAAFMFWY